ncbi:flagellar assembly protein A [Sulfuricurvum sp.]|uniref:flagellar assembly protein A n=1 Tax=Sulfuricurvum sp. TaxID=2025608 RepID=UPI00260CCFC2|nr:flagellar assembly protein A [Sulfuricurvum sp.]MDD2267407.1 FapA family protein [Sulfuricurvum sp.]MDD2783086.1 FapA family protein [Sulfuricurvum sp.]
MGLFTKEGEHEESAVHIKPIIVRTSNVAKELLQAALNFKVSVHTLDFNLLETQTFSKKVADGPAEDWVELSYHELKELKEDFFLNPNIELKQVHEIEIFSILEPTLLDKIDMSIGGNPSLCKIYLTIKAGSTATYYDQFQEDFIRLVNKKKLRANMMIGLFDSMMLQNLGELLAKIRVLGVYHFEAQERYVIGQSYEPVETVDDKLILHYETKRKNQDEHGRIDYAKRGYVISAVENELLIEYIKPKMGESGRNCRGEFITPKPPVIKNEPTFSVGEKIAVIDTSNSIEYRAKVGGYVTFEGGIYDIRTEVDVQEISFRTTGSIDTQLDADVFLNVIQKDPLQDAIGTGMEVTVNVINIVGNIGANANVTAKKATVEGQVHQSATITADELNIDIHKGMAYGKVVNIKRLEHGIVEAEKVFITQATGGQIRAKEITIEILSSNVKMTASHKIEIKNLQGGENLFVIDPLLNESVDNLSDQSKKMEQTKNSMKEIQKELAGYERTWQENIPVMEDLKRKLLHYKKNGIKMPAAFVEKYQQHQQFKEKLEELRNELKTKEDQYAWLREKHTALQSEIFEARIINHDRWKNHNEIIFKLIDPPIEILYIPAHNSEENILGLVENDNGEFFIKVVS